MPFLRIGGQLPWDRYIAGEPITWDGVQCPHQGRRQLGGPVDDLVAKGVGREGDTWPCIAVWSLVRRGNAGSISRAPHPREHHWRVLGCKGTIRAYRLKPPSARGRFQLSTRGSTRPMHRPTFEQERLGPPGPDLEVLGEALAEGVARDLVLEGGMDAALGDPRPCRRVQGSCKGADFQEGMKQPTWSSPNNPLAHPATRRDPRSPCPWSRQHRRRACPGQPRSMQASWRCSRLQDLRGKGRMTSRQSKARNRLSVGQRSSLARTHQGRGGARRQSWHWSRYLPTVPGFAPCSGRAVSPPAGPSNRGMFALQRMSTEVEFGVHGQR